MLNPEHANERLKEFRAADPDAVFTAALPGLTETQRAVCYGLLGRDGQGRALSGMEQYTTRERVTLQILALDDTDRLTVFATLFPRLAPHVEAAWRLHDRLPYQSGGTRKPFRAPNHPARADAARAAWLQQFILVARPYDGQPLAWFAAWAPYIASYHGDAVGILLAAAIDRQDAGGDEVFAILLASARGEHEVGAMGRHVSRALLAAGRPEGWEFMEKLLLAAQRQEGLRQVILEAVDEAHPAAFRRMLRVIRENDLTRFSATIRAVDVWLGFGWDAMSARFATKALQQIETALENPDACAEAVAGGDPQAAYLALWAAAFRDAPAAVSGAMPLLGHADAARRFVAAYLLVQTGLPESAAALAPLLDDPDLRVALLALRAELSGDDLFERLERLVGRLPVKPKALDPLVWDWTAQEADRTAVADRLPKHLSGRSPRRLIPHLPAMSTYGRAAAAEELSKQAVPEAEVRDALLNLVGDPAEYVRDKALKAVTKSPLTAGEASRMEGLLTRKAGDLRRGVLSLLLAQPDVPARSSARHLLAAKDPPSRQAGLEMLRQMVKKERSVAECRTDAAEYREAAPRITEAEDALLDQLLDVTRGEPTLQNGLGLFNPQDCTPRVPPVLPDPPKKWLVFAQKPAPLVTAAARALCASLSDLITANGTQPVRIAGRDEALLGNIQWGFPGPDFTKPPSEDWDRLPLADLWLGWWEGRPAEQRDEDGLELLRALALFYRHSSHSFYMPREDGDEGWGNEWIKEMRDALFGPGGAFGKHANTMQTVLTWLQRGLSQEEAPALLLHAAETTGALGDKTGHTGWRDTGRLLGWLTLTRLHRSQFPDAWTPEHRRRWWRLIHWMDQPREKAFRVRPELSELLDAYELGDANEADLMDQLIGPRPVQAGSYYGTQGFQELRALTGRRGSPLLEAYPDLRAVLDRVRTRVLDVELTRGELPTAASAPALALRSVEGTEALIRLMRALGRDGFSRGRAYTWRAADSLTRGTVFSHLARLSFPTPLDTAEEFVRRVQEACIAPKRLVELAVYAPQWAGFVQRALDWPEFAEAIWWLHAHTKDTQWAVDQEIRDLWTAQAAERTPLSAQSLLDGAVDVAWFGRVHAALGPERWRQVDEAAKYASGGGGHKRAQTFADAMLGRLPKNAVVARIREKRHADSVRALGLLPLAGRKEREADLLDRYRVMQEFLRGSREFGAMRQASEKTAVAVGLENLARTAGYPDPVRLEWAMEAQSVADFAAGPVAARAGDVTVTLAINAWGDPDVTVTKQDKLKQQKVLKAIPPTAKKDPAVAALTARKTEIERQASRMRLSLEGAMCRGDQFTGAEMVRLLEHPVLRPMLRSLILTGADGLSGYPVQEGRALEGLDGRCEPVHAKASLRLAHPHDLLLTGHWQDWQHDCFTRERIQPFKQAFRELYVLTQAEQDDHSRSQRYAGHQVNKSQAYALLGKRGWVGNPYEGDVRRTFHDVGLTASVEFDFGYTTPAEVEGLTIDRVRFTRRGEWQALPLDQVPPRVFSEAMRDLDLVVSVAHQGGVDPEASASTVEMRSSLLREACALLKLSNIRLQGSYALIDGHLGTYSVHLGSAIIHRQPGGHLCIVPVHSQHRGRLFLPFADDDPRTAEVLSKVLLLSKDREIKDPVILEQIFA